MARPREGFQQLTVYLEQVIHQAFKRMALEHGFNMSEWVAEKVREAVIDTGFYDPDRKPISEYKNLADLVKDRQDFLQEKTTVKPEALSGAARGDRPSEIDVLRIGIALGMEQEELDSLIARSFPSSGSTHESNEGGLQTNGAER